MADRTLDQQAEPAPVGECLAFSVRKAARAVTQVYDEALAPAGLRSTQFSLLAVASAFDDGIGLNQLAAQLVMDRTTLSRNLKPLQAEGLVEIRPGADRRSRSIRLTPEGLRRFNEALPYWRTAHQRVSALIGPRRGDRLRADLGLMARLLR